MGLARLEGDLGIVKYVGVRTVAERQVPDEYPRPSLRRNCLLQALPVASKTAPTRRQLGRVPAARLRPIVGQDDIEPAGSEIVDGLGAIARIELF